LGARGRRGGGASRHPLRRLSPDHGLVGRYQYPDFDSDAGGNKPWQQVKEAYPRRGHLVRERPPAGTQDWNDALCTAPARVEGLNQGQEDDRAPGRGRGHVLGRDEHSR